jgi:hypothetical protein
MLSGSFILCMVTPLNFAHNQNLNFPLRVSQITS